MFDVECWLFVAVVVLLPSEAVLVAIDSVISIFGPRGYVCIGSHRLASIVVRWEFDSLKQGLIVRAFGESLEEWFFFFFVTMWCLLALVKLVRLGQTHKIPYTLLDI